MRMSHAHLSREMKWYDDYLARGGADRSANPTPGNKRGGLANIVEKALGLNRENGNDRNYVPLRQQGREDYEQRIGFRRHSGQ